MSSSRIRPHSAPIKVHGSRSYGLNCLHMCLTIYTSVMHRKEKVLSVQEEYCLFGTKRSTPRSLVLSAKKFVWPLTGKESTLILSYPISPHPNDPDWFENYFRLWRRFAEESIHKIQDSASHVVLADITAYYENIDIGLLLSDLRAIGAEPAILEMLSKCLNKWSLAAVPGRSLPQGFSPSNMKFRNPKRSMMVGSHCGWQLGFRRDGQRASPGRNRRRA